MTTSIKASAPPRARVTRATRADAQRNRARVLEAAHELFEETGIATTTEEVAKRAGVGIGTLFRHFPTKASLFEALVKSRLDALADFADATSTKDRKSGEAFFALLERMVEDGPGKRAMIEALEAGGIDVATRIGGSPSKERLKSAMFMLLAAAQSAGKVRADIDVRAVYAVLAGAGAASDHLASEPKLAKRAVRMVLDGLRVPR